MSQCGFKHAYTDLRNVKGGLYINFKLGVVKKALSQSDFQILKSVLSQEQLGHSTCFLHGKKDWRKVKVI